MTVEYDCGWVYHRMQCLGRITVHAVKPSDTWEVRLHPVRGEPEVLKSNIASLDDAREWAWAERDRRSTW